MTDPDARLTEIEIALTHQQRMLDELSSLVRAQADLLARLDRRIAHLSARIDAAEATLPEGAPDADRPPPHW